MDPCVVVIYRGAAAIQDETVSHTTHKRSTRSSRYRRTIEPPRSVDSERIGRNQRVVGFWTVWWQGWHPQSCNDDDGWVFGGDPGRRNEEGRKGLYIMPDLEVPR